MRTRADINDEILTLKLLRTPAKGYTGHYTWLGILAQIEELELGVDDTAEEWNEMLDAEREAVLQARRWKNGDTNTRPSRRWKGLAK
jgi:hypothetical protein